MNFEQYKSFGADDFIMDDDFLQIVKSGTEEQLEEFYLNLPGKNRELDQAVLMLRKMKPGKFQQDQQRKKELWNQIRHAQRKKIQLQYFRYAASILVLVGLGISVFYLSNKGKEKDLVATLKPAENAKLVLASGEMLNINSKHSKIKCSTDGSTVVVNDSMKVAQTVSGESLNQLIVPFGTRSFITLSEGTKVWLNSGSKLTFPAVFQGKKREVKLEGEAFFDVAKDKDKPFFIKTEDFRLKVYGTRFDVQSYDQDKESHIVLVEGKVSLLSNDARDTKEVFLAPSQKAILLKNQRIFEITNIDNAENYTAWVDGYLIFSNEEVKEVLKKVSRYYNTDIEIDSSGEIEKIYGKLDLKDELTRVLDGIAFISEMNYTKQGDRYVFKTNQLN